VTNIKKYLLLYSCYFLYSLALLSARFAAEFDLMSFAALALYVLSFLLLGTFAIGYQQVLKQLPLNIAYFNRVVTIFYAMVFGVILFNEAITLNMIFGAIIIVIGVMMVVKTNE